MSGRNPQAPAALAIAALLTGCGGSEVARTGIGEEPAASVPPGAFLFEDITARVGLDADVEPWPDGTFFLPEISGPGVALFDYDNDGDLDLLQVRYPPPDTPDAPEPDRLYRREADGSYVDVTGIAGIGDPGKGQGVAVGDVDNDGDLDAYILNYGPNSLYRNDGDGTFTNVTERAGVAAGGWSSSAAFCDYDRDGDLDLYLARYLTYEYAGDCLDSDGRPDYCGPSGFAGVPDVLYRNEGDGTFTDATAAAGLKFSEGGKTAKGLGVLCIDLSGDDWPDFYVANDGEPNFLWINGRDGTFAEEGTPRGAAVSRHGLPQGSMGVTAGDVNGDGFLDLFVTNLRREHHTLYLGQPGAMFADRSVESQLSRHDNDLTGFGCGFFDYDLDGDLDLAVVNGRVSGRTPVPGAKLGAFWNRYAEPNLLFENDGTGAFASVGDRAPDFAARIEIGRGLAFGDLDDDGDPDMVVSSVGNVLRVFDNVAPRQGRHWLRLRVLTGERDAFGATVTVRAGERRFLALAIPNASYQSSSDPRLVVGLGESDVVDDVEVLWPDGRRERFAIPGVDRDITLRQGAGEFP